MTRTRSLEVWHIPKRRNIHQVIGAIEILSGAQFNGKSWTSQKKEAFNTKLGQAGLTESGGVLSPSARRTFEALLKYLGFICIDNESTPPTINVTKAGFELIAKHSSVLNLKNNLREVTSNNLEVLESDVVCFQMEKLQLSNPTVREDCINILLFPFRTTLSILKELGHISQTELGYIIFRMKNVDEIDLTVQRIRSFRALPDGLRNAEIESFKKTLIGNLTLVQAPTASYYIGLCVSTGLCKKIGDKLFLKNGMNSVVDVILAKYKNIDPFDFQDDSRLWIEYFGDINRLAPPKLLSIALNLLDNVYVKVLSMGGQEIGAYAISKDSPEFSLPFFLGESYKFEFYSFVTAHKVHEEIRIVTDQKLEFTLPSMGNSDVLWDLHSTISRIEGLINSREFDEEFSKHIAVVKVITGKSFNHALLRGGRLEYLFYKLLTILKDRNQINDVVWNGKLSNLGIPQPAPGGKEGNPDIYFYVGNRVYVLELTTIRGNAKQWSAEGASVPDHIMNLSRKIPKGYEIIGLFSAPTIAPRVQTHFDHISESVGIPHLPIPIDELLKILLEDELSALTPH